MPFHSIEMRKRNAKERKKKTKNKTKKEHKSHIEIETHW